MAYMLLITEKILSVEQQTDREPNNGGTRIR